MNQRTLQRIRRSSLADEVALQIEKAIKEGRWLPGQQLPAERQLSKELGISRPVLRQALATLAGRGLIEAHHGSGNYVTDRAAEAILAAPLEWLVEHLGLVEQFYEARLAVEPECAALASKRGTAAEIEELGKIVAAADEVVNGDGESVVAFIGLDIDFHATVARMAGNPFLYRMLDAIIHPETDLRHVLHRLPRHLPIAQERHKRILEAIRSGDSEGARLAMRAALEGPSHDIQALLLAKEKTV